jgi:hypothetical protein
MEKKKSNGQKNIKKRNWSFIVYLDSAPVDWIERLQRTGLQCAISPLHDKDLEPTGEVKKAHWHVIAVYSGPTSYNVVKALSTNLNAPIPQALESVRGYYRYFTHRDNQDKCQYDEKEIKTINGFNVLDFLELTKSEVNAIKKRLVEVIIENRMTEYAVLINYTLYMGTDAEFDVATSHTIFFNAYLTSQRHIAEIAKEEMLRIHTKDD